MHQALIERPQSGFPLSIGTSLSLETIFTAIQPVIDESRVVKNIPDLSVYSLYVFNISTLLRNLINSIKYSDLVIIPKKDIYETLLEEIEFLSTIFQNNNLNIRFYVHNYQYVKDTYEKESKLRKSSTDKQLFIDGINEYCLDKLRKEDEVDYFHKDIHYSKEDTVLLFTHIPFDLLSYHNFLKLDLLESHTGTVKSRKDWWSKYYPIPNYDMSFLPFMEYLLSIFGDGVMFKPSSLKERIDLYEVLKRKKVHPLMSEISTVWLLGKG